MGGVGNWEQDTPRVGSSSYDDIIERPAGVDTDAWGQEQTQLDRDWYNQEEQGVMLVNLGRRLCAIRRFQRILPEKRRGFQKERNCNLKLKQKRMTARQVQFQKDNNLWEKNRMLQSGVIQRASVDTDFDDETEDRVHLLVRDLKPPFLDGKMVFTQQVDTVQCLRDPTGDLATCSAKGSRIVMEKREQRERARAAAKMAQLAGSQLGNIMGVQVEKDAGDNGKQDSQFASHMQEKSATLSNFSLTKTLSQQRQFLPAFAVREELLSLIRDNPSILV